MHKMKCLAILGVFWVILSGCRGAEGLTSEIGEQDSVGASTPIAALTEPQEANISEDLADSEPNYCLECHTDKQRLIDTARLEEEVIKESTGMG